MISAHGWNAYSVCGLAIDERYAQNPEENSGRGGPGPRALTLGQGAADAPEAYVLYRELDYFEQLAALESQAAFDLELIKLMLGRTLIDRWEMWKPAIEAAHGPGVYPLFEGLVEKLRRALDDPARCHEP